MPNSKAPESYGAQWLAWDCMPHRGPRYVGHWKCNVQATLLRYTLPAMACTPPLLLSLIRQSSARGVLLTCHVLVSPSMPGSLADVTIELHIPSSSQDPLKVPPRDASVPFAKPH